MKYTIRQVFEQFGSDYLNTYHPSYEQKQVFDKILECRTEKLGTRIYQCEKCGDIVFSYNSCNDRHCPNCQNYKKELWIANHKNETLDITYYHTVVTTPAELHPIFYHNKEKMYNLLIKAGCGTIMELAEDEKYLGAKVGITAMLHTWSQIMNYHPHLHMVVTGGGLDKQGNFKKSRDDYFLPVKVISRKFRGKLLSLIMKEDLKFYNDYEYLNDKEELKKYLSPLYNKEWVCYSKTPFKDVGEVYNYLGRYAYRICISNERIVNITDTHVWFNYRDRMDNNKIKTMKVEGKEFIRMFLMHVLPKSFMKIRHYGILAGRDKKERIKKLKIQTKTKEREEEIISKISLLNKMIGRDITRCIKCNGEMHLIQTIRKKKPPDIAQMVREERFA